MPFRASLPRASEPHFLPEAASLLIFMPQTSEPNAGLSEAHNRAGDARVLENILPFTFSFKEI